MQNENHSMPAKNNNGFPDLTDEEVAGRVQDGNVELYEILMQRYEAKLSRYARKFLSNREDIEDVIQQVFIKTYSNIQSFNVSMRFSPWIYRIAHNELVNALKKKKNAALPFFDADTIFPHPVANENPSSDSEKRELAELMAQCLDKLDIKYREPLILYFLEELSYKEISDILQIPIATVGVRINRAKEKLKIHASYLK
jgi:RNA polymerase sigma-70 factor (ECF subfamily)